MKDKLKNIKFIGLITSGTFWLSIIMLLILVLSVRGLPGNPSADELSQDEWSENGPFELSPERGRFALLYSVVEDNTLFFSQSLAKFAIPDLGYLDGKFVSRFAPSVSALVAPGYLLGRHFGFSQVGTFLIIGFFAFLNVLLIRAIAILLGAKPSLAMVGALTFLFASPSYAYAVNLYQHHISTFIILLSIYVLIKYEKIWSYILVFFLCGFSVTVDYPNFFLMLPIGLMALARLISAKANKSDLKINIKTYKLLTVMVAVIPMLFLLWFNYASFGSPFRLSGNVPGIRNFDDQGRPLAPRDANPNDIDKYLNPDTQEKTSLGYFLTRNLTNGFYIHFFSPDRGIIYFTPVVLLGIFGIVIFYKEKHKYLNLLLSIIGINILLYSMWGDPWGGWAFGSRYMIPTYALLAIFIAIALTKYKKNFLFLLLFLTLFLFSAFVNTAGALSSSANPPKVEVLELEALSHMQQKYTFTRNLDFLRVTGKSKSFIFITYAQKHISAWYYFLAVYGAVISTTILPIIYYLIKASKIKDFFKFLFGKVKTIYAR